VRDLPDEFETAALTRRLADHWGFEVAALDYAPVGFGSYHWIATDAAGSLRFVTVDDLDRKPWLGSTRELALDGLARAYGTAVALRDAGLGFVVAPILTTGGEAVRRVGARHSIALFPYVDGRSADFGAYENPEDRTAVLAMVAELHRATASVDSIPGTIDLDIPGRIALEAGLRDVGQAWVGGPYSEPARSALAERASEVVELLGLFDRLSREVAERDVEWVVTHGEPHAANVIRTETGRVLIDWDTVALAPRERDLWMVVKDSDDATAYAAVTGSWPDAVAMDCFRLLWDLADLAAFIDVLRSPHRDSDDTRKALQGVRTCVAIRGQWAELLAARPR
jgi:spectinomycin phosphotransferase